MSGFRLHPLRSIPFLLIILAGGFGCAASSPARYTDIQSEYAATVCRLDRPADIPASAQTCDIDRPVSLEDAIGIALTNNPDHLIALARIEQSNALLKKANAAFYPSISVGTEYLRGDAPSAYLFKTIDQRGYVPGTDFNNPGWFENYESSGTVAMNLYNGGRDRLQQRMARSTTAQRRLERIRIENALRSSVIRSYYQILAAQAFVSIARESVDTVEEQLRVMRVRFSAGSALKSDILSLEVRLAEAQEQVLKSSNRLRIARTSLANLLGIDPNRDLELIQAGPLQLNTPTTMAEGMTFALAHRPEIQQARERVLQSQMGLDMAASGYLPRVDLQARYWVDDPQMAYNQERDNYTAAVVLNWVLFSGMSTQADRTKAKAALKEMLIADKKALDAVKFDVKTAYLRLNEALERLDVTQKSVAAAKESFGLVKKQYMGGSATITRYLDAELALNRSRMNATTALYDREIALADVSRAIGFWAGDMRPGNK